MESSSDAQLRARELLKGPQRYTCLVGGTRAGKTFLIVREIIERARVAPGSFHALLRFRGNAAKASLSGQTIPRVRRLCFPHLDMRHLRTEDIWTIKSRAEDDSAPRDAKESKAKEENEAKLIVGGLDDDYRIEKILGREFSTIFLNEASQIPYESALVAFTRLAEVSPHIEQKIFVDLNPTNKLHWTHRMFVEKCDPITRLPLVNAGDFAVAHLKPQDNERNLTPAYIESLAQLPERQRRRFYEGVYVDAIDHALWTYDLIAARAPNPRPSPSKSE